MVIFNSYFKGRRLIFTLVEGFIIFLTIYLSIAIRFKFDMEGVYSFDPLYLKSLSFVVVYLLVFHYFELFYPPNYSPSRQMLIKLIQAFVTAPVLLFILYFFFPSLALGRGIFLMEHVILPPVILLWRMCYARWIARSLPRERVLIFGTASLARKIGDEIDSHKSLGLEVIGFVEDVAIDERGKDAAKGNR